MPFSLPISDSVILRAPLPEDAPLFAPLTWNAYRDALALTPETREDRGVVVQGAWVDGHPAGLLIAMEKSTGLHLLSLCTAPALRRRGIARQLLDWVAARGPAGTGLSLWAEYSDRLPGAEAFAALTAAAGWEAPEAVRRRIRGRLSQTLSVFRDRSGLIGRLTRGGFQARPWHQAQDRILALADALAAQGDAPDWAAPRPWLDRLHPEASMALVNASEEVCGWVVCEYQAPLDRWHFPVGWVRAPEAGRGWLLAAFAEGARRLAATQGEEAVAVFETGREQHGMWQVLDRHFAPHVDWADHLMRVRRSL